MRFFRNSPKLALSVLPVVLGLAGLFLAAQVGAQEAAEPAPSPEAADSPTTQPSIVVGTFKPRQVFQAYPGLAGLRAKAQEARKAQQDGDRQKLMQLQQEMQAEQQRVGRQFQSDMEKVMPKVAKAGDIDLVAVEIVYASDEVKTKDVTATVVRNLKTLAPKKDESKPQPQPDLQLLPGQ